MQIIIKSPFDGKTILLEVQPSDSIENLKAKIREIYESDCSLVFGGGLLEEGQGHTLSDYDIQEYSMLYLVLLLEGGSGCASVNFNSFEKPVKLNFSKSGAEWNRIGAGMNLWGKCNNYNCKAYDKIVYCPKGFGFFNINKESVISTCPICKTIVSECNNIIFWRCKYTINGQIKGESQLKKIEKIVRSEDSCETFENGDGNQRSWLFLEIQVEEIS